MGAVDGGASPSTPTMRTPLEQIWFDILTENNIAFQEQVSVGNYIADFLVGNFDIEVDGLQHRLCKKNRNHDKKRDKYFESLGYTVIRIPMNYHNFHKKKQQEKFKKQIDFVLSKLI